MGQPRRPLAACPARLVPVRLLVCLGPLRSLSQYNTCLASLVCLQRFVLHVSLRSAFGSELSALAYSYELLKAKEPNTPPVFFIRAYFHENQNTFQSVRSLVLVELVGAS